MAAEHKTALPDEAILAVETDRTREALSRRGLLLGEKRCWLDVPPQSRVCQK